MPVITRSLSMGVNDEVKDYFSKLIEPLATKETINTLFEQFENKVLSESMILMKQNTIDNLIIKCDDNEQYSRRSCVRINGIEKKMLKTFWMKLKSAVAQWVFPTTLLTSIEHIESARYIRTKIIKTKR